MTKEEQSKFARDWYNNPITTIRERIFLEELFPELKREKLTEFEKELARFAWRGIGVDDLTIEAKEILHKGSKTLLELARKQIIDEVCEWLDKHMPSGEVSKELACEVIQDFKKAMEEEK